MSHEVFISYSSIDKATADLLCAALEASGTGTWIAPRDVMPGKPYGEALIDAINDSKVMVLVLSEHSNHSSQVVREVERAASKGIPIIPFRIAEIRLAKSLEYFLSTCHWLDAFGETVESHIPRLTEAINATLRAVYDGETLELEQDAIAAAKNRPRPAGPRGRNSRGPVLAEPVDESIYVAELIHAHTGAPPQRKSAGPYASPQHYPQHQATQRGSNALGVAGLTASVIGLFTCGMFSPIGFLISLLGLFRAPRGNAFAGTAIGAAGSLLLAVCFAYGFFGGFNTTLELEDAAAHIDGYYYNAGDYPDEGEANNLLYGHEDGWGQPLRYRRNWPDGFEIRSAGLDGAFDTPDDQTLVR